MMMGVEIENHKAIVEMWLYVYIEFHWYMSIILFDVAYICTYMSRACTPYVCTYVMIRKGNENGLRYRQYGAIPLRRCEVIRFVRFGAFWVPASILLSSFFRTYQSGLSPSNRTS